MRLEESKYLEDIKLAADHALVFVKGRTFEEYEADAILHAAVERQMEIVGTGLASLASENRELTSRLTHSHRFIAIRDLLICGYSGADDHLIWDVVSRMLPNLRRQVGSILDER